MVAGTTANAACGEEAAQLWVQAQGRNSVRCGIFMPFMCTFKVTCKAVVLCGHRRGDICLQANVRNYYMQFEESQTQSLIDSKIMEFAQHARAPSLVRM